MQDMINEPADGDIAAGFLALNNSSVDEKPEDNGDSDALPSNNAETPEEQGASHLEGEPEAADSEDLPEVDEPDAEADEATDDEGEAEEETQQAAPTKVEHTLPDGTVVNQEELYNGYLRQSDYTRKTEEIAQERQAFQAESDQIRQQTLGVLRQLNAQYQAINPVNLLLQASQQAEEEGDTDQANRLWRQAQDLEKQISQHQNALAWEEERAKKAQSEQEAKASADYLREQSQKLYQKMPSLSTDKGKQDFQKTVRNALKHVGFSDEEISGKNKPDHRDAMMAFYAGKYLESVNAKPQVAKALQGKAVAPKPGVRVPTGSVNAKRDAAIRQISKNPSADGALASLFKTF